eukprot:PITA_01092
MSVIQAFRNCSMLLSIRPILHLQERNSCSSILTTLPNATNISSIDIQLLCKHGRLQEALQVLNATGRPVDSCTYVSLLQACIKTKTLSDGKLIHAHIVKMGLVPDRYLSNTLINMYARCGSIQDACRVFDLMPARDAFSWTAMIAGYTKQGFTEEALIMFCQMQRRTDVQPNQFTFASVLQACPNLGALKAIHEVIISRGFQSDVFVGSTLVHSYAIHGSIQDARHLFNKMPQRNTVSWNAMIAGCMLNGHVYQAQKLFQEMPERNLISWTAMIAGYAQNGHSVEALELFQQMLLAEVRPDLKTFASVLPACANLVALKQGMEIHKEVIKGGFVCDDFVGSALVHMYVNCGSIKRARKVLDKMPLKNMVSWTAMLAGYAQSGLVGEALKLFQAMPEHNVASWTAMIAGYAQNGYGIKALKLFRQMQLVGLKPNIKTFVSVLPACASLAALKQGLRIHKDIIRSGFECDVYVASALIDMYSKCGSIEEAHTVFSEMHQPNVVSWNALIAGYAMHGCGDEAVKLFEQMQDSGLKPNHITLVCVLFACCHSGLVSKGKQYFDCMVEYYDITPAMEHYGCMVDLFGRAGNLDGVKDILDKMPLKPDTSLWVSLLGACRIHNNIELGEHVAENLFELDCNDAAPYVLLSSLYAATGRWNDIEKAMSTSSSITLTGAIPIPPQENTPQQATPAPTPVDA